MSHVDWGEMQRDSSLSHKHIGYDASSSRYVEDLRLIATPANSGATSTPARHPDTQRLDAEFLDPLLRPTGQPPPTTSHPLHPLPRSQHRTHHPRDTTPTSQTTTTSSDYFNSTVTVCLRRHQKSPTLCQITTSSSRQSKKPSSSREPSCTTGTATPSCAWPETMKGVPSPSQTPLVTILHTRPPSTVPSRSTHRTTRYKGPFEQLLRLRPLGQQMCLKSFRLPSSRAPQLPDNGRCERPPQHLALEHH